MKTTRKSDINMPTPRTALFPGSFNPFTIGHKSLVDRTLQFADRIIIALGINLDKTDQSDIEDRVNGIKAIFKNEPAVEVITYSTLTGQLAKDVKADFIVRGVRNAADFEYEMNLATANRNLFGIETVILPTLPYLSWISSSTVRELDRFGYDTSELLP